MSWVKRKELLWQFNNICPGHSDGNGVRMAPICQFWYKALNTLPHFGLLLTFQSSVQPFTYSPNVTFADCHSYFPRLISRYFNLLYHPTHRTQFLCTSLLSLVSPLSSSVPGTAENTIPLCSIYLGLIP